MGEHTRSQRPVPEPLGLAAAYAELHHLILEAPDVTDFLHQLTVLAAAIVPGSHCGITLRRDDQVATVASSDAAAMRMDEIQYLQGSGPCLEAMGTSRQVDVPDMTQEVRWGDYSAHALAHGVRSVVSLPLIIGGESIGALNLFSSVLGAFGQRDVDQVRAFTDQAATALTILLRQSDRLTLDAQLREALASRAIIDQALGIMMLSQQISSRDAFEILRRASQNSNRKIGTIAADIIESMSGHLPQPPRPLSDRRDGSDG